jgi:hypothetical protein
MGALGVIGDNWVSWITCGWRLARIKCSCHGVQLVNMVYFWMIMG